MAELLARAYRPKLVCVLTYRLLTLQIPRLPLPSIPVGTAPSQAPLPKVWTADWPRSHETLGSSPSSRSPPAWSSPASSLVSASTSFSLSPSIYPPSHHAFPLTANRLLPMLL